MDATPKGLQSAFLFFHIAGGIVGLPLVVLSIVVSRQRSKHPTLLNFCATWFFSSIIYTLLFFAGKQGGQFPPYSLCVAQASMANGALPMTSAAGVALVAHIWHGLGPPRPWSQIGLATHRLQTARLAALLAFPYILFLAFAIPAAIVSHIKPELVTSQSVLFYCTVNTRTFNILVPTITIIAMVSILVLEALICLKIYQSAPVRAGIERTGSWLFWLRVTGFSIYAIMTLIMAALLLSNNRTFAPYVVQAFLPFIVFLFIATQKEVLQIWRGWLTTDAAVEASSGHRRLRSFTSLLGDDRHRPPTPSFGTTSTQYMTGSAPQEPGYFIAQSSVPASAKAPDRPKRPTRTGLSGLDTFFSNKVRPAKDRSRSRTRTPMRLHKDLPSTPIPPVPRVPQLPELPLSREPQPIQPYDVAFPVDAPHTNMVSAKGPPVVQVSDETKSGVGYGDLAKVIDTQRQTIARLLDEVGLKNRALDRLKTVEQTLHKTQNQLVTERRTANELRKHVNRIENNVQTQKSQINILAVSNKELDIKLRLQEEELLRIKSENQSLSDALQHSVRNEMQWNGNCEKMKSDNEALRSEVQALKEERDVLLDIWSTLESPIDWELQRGRGGPPRMSPQHAYPDLAEKMRQRASTPGRPSSRLTNRHAMVRTDTKSSTPSLSFPGRPSRAKSASIGGFLDRLRPRMMEISEKLELSEKVSGLEEIVREQAVVIEQLEANLTGESVERMLQEIEGSLGSWSVPRSISSSMIPERDATSRHQSRTRF